MNRTDLEKKLDEALSKANWGAPNTLLREIAASTNQRDDYPVVRHAVVWDDKVRSTIKWGLTRNSRFPLSDHEGGVGEPESRREKLATDIQRADPSRRAAQAR